MMCLLVASMLGISLDEVVSNARIHSPLIIATLRDRDRAADEEYASRGAFDPSLKARAEVVPFGQYENRVLDTWVEQPIAPWSTRLFAGYRYGAGEFGPYDKKLETNALGELRAGIELSLLRNRELDERRGRLAIAGAASRIADVANELQGIEVTRLTAQRYWDWVAAGERLRIARALLRLAEDRQDATEKRVRAGDLAAVEAVDNQRLVLQRHAIVVVAERALGKAANDLALFYRDAEGAPLVLDESQLPGAIPEPRAVQLDDDMIRGAIERHPELRRVAAQRTQLEVDAGLARNLGLPRLDLQALVAQDVGEGSAAQARPELRLAVNFELPIVARTAVGRERAALSGQARLSANEQLLRDRIAIGARDAAQAALLAIERLRFLRSEVERAREVERGERTKALAGDSNLLLVNLREQATADAESRVVDALADHHRALADLEAVLARNGGA